MKWDTGSRAAGSAAPAAGGTLGWRLAPRFFSNRATREHFFRPQPPHPLLGGEDEKMRTTTKR
ncbi:MAG: hypothetical protein D6790_13470, partial [Caldilineae bacterium]